MTSTFSKRIIAYIADFFVLSAVMWIVSYFLALMLDVNSPVFQYLVYVVPVLTLIYFILCEKFKGATVGKAVMYLQVRSKNGARISWSQAIVRNLSKIYWIPIVFDWAIGKLLIQDRFLCNISKTVVISERN